MGEVASLALQTSMKQYETSVKARVRTAAEHRLPLGWAKVQCQESAEEQAAPADGSAQWQCMPTASWRNVESGEHAWRCVEIHSRESLQRNDLHHHRILLLITLPAKRSYNQLKLFQLGLPRCCQQTVWSSCNWGISSFYREKAGTSEFLKTKFRHQEEKSLKAATDADFV